MQGPARGRGRLRAAAGASLLNLVLEMRVIRDSNVWLSPAFSTNGEHHCYFELISVAGTPKCHEFLDGVATAWMNSPELAARPHSAKYFADIPGIVPIAVAQAPVMLVMRKAPSDGGSRPNRSMALTTR